MNERGHAVNAVLLSLGVGVILEPDLSLLTLETVAMVTPPIVLGALFPGLATTFGTHRKTFHNVWVLAIAVAFPPVRQPPVRLDRDRGPLRPGPARQPEGHGRVPPASRVLRPPGRRRRDQPVGRRGDPRRDGVRLALLGALVVLGHEAQLARPDLPVPLRSMLALE